eukprot:SAG31_NODE_3697_length_3978_cov_1.827791_3_plen_82_part_01
MMNFFDVDPRATGTLIIKDQVFSRGCGYATEQPASFIWRNVSDPGMQENLIGFRVIMDGVTFRDWSWYGNSRGYFPIARGFS